MKDVVRKTIVANTKTPFRMKLKRSKFLVKNFTEGNITVSLGDNAETSLIGPDCFEVLFNNIPAGGYEADRTNVVTVTGNVGGIVEVSSVD